MIGSQVRALVRPPPSPYVETFISLFVFTALECGLFAPGRVSWTVSAPAQGPVCEPVSAV
jgi:hypothetical protein